MNPRIYELWEQSTGAKVPKDGFYSSASKYNIEKFAELIVCECLETIETSPVPQLPKREIDRIYSVVKQHFGIEK